MKYEIAILNSKGEETEHYIVAEYRKITPRGRLRFTIPKEKRCVTEIKIYSLLYNTFIIKEGVKK